MGLDLHSIAKRGWQGILHSAGAKGMIAKYRQCKNWVISTDKYQWYLDLDKSLRLGLKATAIYLISFIVIVGPYDILNFMITTNDDLNEIGDFLAGVLGPLSIFWVVLGYWQNQKALGEQATELGNAVQSARDHLEVERSKLEPNLVLSNFTVVYWLQGKRTRLGSGSFRVDSGAPVKSVHLDITFVNAGASTSEVNLMLSSSPEFDSEKFWSKKLPIEGGAKISTGDAVNVNHQTVDFLINDGDPLDYQENALFEGMLKSPENDLYLDVVWIGQTGKKIDRYILKTAYVDGIPEGLANLEHTGIYNDIRVIELLEKGQDWDPEKRSTSISFSFTPESN